MISPIAQMQRATYPRERHPLAHLTAVRMGAFGDLTQGITGVKAGVSAGTTATALGAGIAGAIGAGAAAGSVIPIVGTAIGAIVGLVASGVFNHRTDPEVGNFNNAIALVRAQGPQAVLGIQDKYLVLAGLFDLLPNQIKGNIPIYKKYGRMGEQKFVTDMCNLIQHAADQGIITANDTVQSVYDKVVAPWIAGFGFGPMQDANAEMINTLILGLIGEYVSGQFKSRWYARGGDFAFNNLPLFKLPAQSAVTPTASGTPTPVSNPPASNPASLPTATPPAQQSAVPVPAGFVMVGSIGTLPAYQGPDGYFYVWSGTTMSPATGTVHTADGQVYAVNGGVPATQPQSVALPSLTTNTQAGVSPYAQSYAPYASPSAGIPTVVPVTAPAQPAAQPVAAGVNVTGLPSWLSWGAVAGVAVLMFATARPESTARSRGRIPRRGR